MNKKELITPFFVAALSLLFVAICFAIYLTDGKSKKWITRKMRIGGLLLTLTAASCNGGGGQVTCYEMAEINAMWINPTSQNAIEVKLDTGNVINGFISTIQGKDFSFLVSDSAGAKYQKGIIALSKDSIGNSIDFKIELDKNLKPGKYMLMLYATGVKGQDTVGSKREFDLVVKNE
jgi:hypothetical protein